MKGPAAALVATLAEYDPDTLWFFIGSTRRSPAPLLDNGFRDFAREDGTAVALLQTPTASWICLVRYEYAVFAMGA